MKILLIGGTGAVGGAAARALLENPGLEQLTLLGRREAELEHPKLRQHRVDLFKPADYAELLAGHRAAICCVGVGEPSKMDDADFVRIDKELPLTFAGACKEAGAAHFQLLSSVGVSLDSRSMYLRTKGELEQGLRDLAFERLSLFHPSMILTPENRYGVAQGLTLAIWPKLTPLLAGGARKYRGVQVAQLGAAFAANVFASGSGEEVLEWDDFQALAKP